MSLLFLTVMFQSESCMIHRLSGQISFQKCQKRYLLKTQLSSKHTKVIVDLTLWPITGVQYDVTVLAQSDWWNEGFLRHRPLWTFKVVLKWRAYRSVNFCHRKNSKPPLKRAQKTGFNKLYFIEICNYHVTRKKIRPKWTRPKKGKESEARLERSFSQFVTVEYNQILTTKVELRYKWHL